MGGLIVSDRIRCERRLFKSMSSFRVWTLEDTLVHCRSLCVEFVDEGRFLCWWERLFLLGEEKLKFCLEFVCRLR